jgi:hypothetical protein
MQNLRQRIPARGQAKAQTCDKKGRGQRITLHIQSAVMLLLLLLLLLRASETTALTWSAE